jgi:ABC-type transporter Mla subunit MlaD
VDESGQTLEEIVQEVNRLTVTVGEIAAASKAQSSGISEVNKTVTQIDAFTQQNAALVQQAAAASDLLGRQSRELDELSSFFTVAGTAKAPARDVYSGVERRAADRPWGGPAAGTPTPVAAPAAKPEVDDQYWAEF